MSTSVSRRAVLLGGGGTVAAAVGVGSVAASSSAEAAFRTLRVGMTGSDVLRLQKSLSASTFWCGTPDGSFGALTQQAVWALQKAYGKSRTGVVDLATWNRAMSGLRPLGRYAGNGVEIHLQRQLLFIMRNGKVAYTFNTSTGNGARFKYLGGYATAITPKGTFRIFRKSANEGSTGWVNGPLGSMYKPRFFTTDGIAIHGSTSIPAYPASHGCCRVSTAGQDFMIRGNLIPIGNTTVRVY